MHVSSYQPMSIKILFFETLAMFLKERTNDCYISMFFDDYKIIIIMEHARKAISSEQMNMRLEEKY